MATFLLYICLHVDLCLKWEAVFLLSTFFALIILKDKLSILSVVIHICAFIWQGVKEWIKIPEACKDPFFAESEIFGEISRSHSKGLTEKATLHLNINYRIIASKFWTVFLIFAVYSLYTVCLLVNIITVFLKKKWSTRFRVCTKLSFYSLVNIFTWKKQIAPKNVWLACEIRLNCFVNQWVSQKLIIPDRILWLWRAKVTRTGKAQSCEAVPAEVKLS